MAGLGFLKSSLSDIAGDIGNTLLHEALGGSKGVMYREAPTAGRLLGVNNEYYTFHNSSAPRPGFMYMVKFVSPLNATTTRTGFNPSSTLSSKTGFNFQAKTVSRPSVQFQTEVLNQYNKKRVIYTGRTHTPVNITLHDDVAGKLQNFWKSYFAHYFQDGTLEASGSLFWDIMADKISDNGTDGYGMRTITGTNEKYYFDRIIIYQFFGGYFTTITLFNPVISNFEYSNDLSYDNASGTLPEVTITFEYENVSYDTNPQQVTPVNAFDFGFQYDYNEPPLGTSKQKLEGYLDSFLTRNGVNGSVLSRVGRQFGLGETTTGRIADSLLSSIITQTVPNNTSKSIKNNILNVGVNAFSDLINGQVNLGNKHNQTTTGSFPLSDNYSDYGRSEFSAQMEGLSNRLLKTGLYSEVSTSATDVNSKNFKNNSLIITTPNGEIQFTEKGLAGMNALVSQSSIFGVAERSITDNEIKQVVSTKSPIDLKDLYG